MDGHGMSGASGARNGSRCASAGDNNQPLAVIGVEHLNTHMTCMQFFFDFPWTHSRWLAKLSHCVIHSLVASQVILFAKPPRNKTLPKIDQTLIPK